MSGIKDHKKRARNTVSRSKTGARRTSSSASGERRAQPEKRRMETRTTSARRASAGRDDVRANQRSSMQRKRRSAKSGMVKVKRTIKPSFKDKLVKRLPVILAVLGALLLIWAGVTVKHAISLRHYDKTKIADNVYIGSIDVSGMTKKQAQSEVKSKLKEARAQDVTLSVGSGSVDSTLKDLGLTIKDYKKLAGQALAYGSKGSVNKRYRRLQKLKKEPYEVPLVYAVDSKKAAKELKTLCASLEDSPVNASLKVDGKKVKVVEGHDGSVVDTKKTIANIEDHLNDDWTGEELFVEVLSKTASPEVSAADLEDVKDKLGSYDTSFEGSDAGRAANIELGCSLINGTIVQPGETFSADAAMRPYTEERGWENAASYEQGDVVDSLGGGICQISSTLYNAVLYSELEVVQRQQHSMRVSYVEPGRDAAIAGDVKDFKFKNSTKYPIYIYGKVENQSVYFAIYGKETREKDRKITFESEVLSTSDFTTVYKASNDPVGQMYISASGHEGMTAKLWKTVTVNGEEQEPVEVNTTEYQPQNTIINVGTAGSAAQANIIANAIATQDEATIRKAISKAYSY